MRNLGYAATMVGISQYNDKHFGNAILDRDENFILIDYEYILNQSSTRVDDFRVQSLGNFIDLNPYILSDQMVKNEQLNALLNFLIFPLELLKDNYFETNKHCKHSFNSSVDETIAYKKLLNNSSSFFVSNYENTESTKNKIKELLNDLNNSQNKLIDRFSHSVAIRNIDLEQFETLARQNIEICLNSPFLKM